VKKREERGGKLGMRNIEEFPHAEAQRTQREELFSFVFLRAFASSA